MGKARFMAKFALGRVVATPGALRLIEAAGANANVLLGKHLTLDRGLLCDEDVRANERALADGSRVFSCFAVGDGRVWVITEAEPRSSTCILLPDEY